MTFSLPNDFEAWARGEVAAGRAPSVEALAVAALEAHRRRVEAFRASLDAAVAEAEREGWIEGDAFVAEMDSLIERLDEEARSAAPA